MCSFHCGEERLVSTPLSLLNMYCTSWMCMCVYRWVYMGVCIWVLPWWSPGSIRDEREEAVGCGDGWSPGFHLSWGDPAQGLCGPEPGPSQWQRGTS